jgi:hypothetical protein
MRILKYTYHCRDELRLLSPPARQVAPVDVLKQNEKVGKFQVHITIYVILNQTYMHLLISYLATLR